MKKILLLALSALAMNLFALDIYGIMNLTENTTINEDVHIYPGGVVQNDYWSVTFTVNGNLINEGEIRNNPGANSLYLACNGNVDNLGTITCYQMFMGGSTATTLKASSPIDSYDLIINNANGIIASGDINLSTKTHFNNYTFDLNGFDLSLDTDYIENAAIDASEGSNITFSNDAFFYDVDLTGGNLYGEIKLDDDVNFYSDVTNYGYIQNFYYSMYLDIYGNIINHGTIRNNPGANTLYVNSYGNIENHGEWINYSIDLYGSVPQTVSLYDGANFNTNYFDNYNETSIIAGTDLYFEGCGVDFNNAGPLDIGTNGVSLNFDGGYFYRGTIQSAEIDPPVKLYPSVTGSNYFYLESCTINDVALYGTVEVWSGVVFEDTVVNYGTLQNAGNGSWLITINGSFSNEGTVQSNPGAYSLYINFYGTEISNNGIWNNYQLSMYGTSQQTLSCGGITQPFSPDYFMNYNPSSLLAASDLYFDQTRIDLNDSGYVDLTSSDLYVSGNYLYRGTLVGTPGVTKINLSNDAYIENINASDVILEGTHNVWGDVNLSGQIVNNAIVQNGNASYTLNIDGDLTNNSSFNSAHGYSLYINLSGDLVNNGLFYPYVFNVNGTETQTFSSPDTLIYAEYFHSENPNPVVFGSDISFSSTKIEFNNTGGIDLSGGYTLSADGDWIYQTPIIGGNGAGINLNGNAYLHDLTASDLELSGTVMVYHGVTFTGSFTNNGTLQNFFDSSTLTINGDLDNFGSINDYAGYSLYIETTGNITNDGTWINYTTKLNGTSDQYVNVFSPIGTSRLYIASELGTSPFQWYKDSEALDLAEVYGEDQQEMYFSGVEIDSIYFGTYYCQTGEGTSRSIIFREPVYAAPVITGIYHTGEYIVVQWNMINDADHYDIYSSSDPYSDPVTWTYEGSQNNTPTKAAWIDWMDYDVTPNKKFYFVKAVY